MAQENSYNLHLALYWRNLSPQERLRLNQAYEMHRQVLLKKQPMDAVTQRRVQPVPVYSSPKQRLAMRHRLARRGTGPSIRITHKSEPSWLLQKVRQAMLRSLQIYREIISLLSKPTTPTVKSQPGPSVSIQNSFGATTFRTGYHQVIFTNHTWTI
jgi:hypothetical protein